MHHLRLSLNLRYSKPMCGDGVEPQGGDPCLASTEPIPGGLEHGATHVVNSAGKAGTAGCLGSCVC
jgi:hypothetical protein